MEQEKLDILIFGAHPDDAEIGMGATIYKHTQAGYKVAVCDLTFAEMSSNGTVESRKAEAEQAGRLLGLAVRSNLGLPDRGLRIDPEQIASIVEEIRRLRPRIVFAPYWQDRHPDHVMCSRLVEEAVFNAKLRKYLPGSEPVSVEHLYFYFINDVYEPQMIVDVSDVYGMKAKALNAYRTQFYADASAVATPINQGFLELLEARDRMAGQKSGFRYAEGFVGKRPFAVSLF